MTPIIAQAAELIENQPRYVDYKASGPDAEGIRD